MDAPSPSLSPAIPRSAEYVVQIAVPPDAVWKALTDPKELVRWFPLTAHVAPGAGGEMTLRWEDQGMDHLAIHIWNPARHLQVAMQQPSGSPPVVHDFTLEDHGASTVLRLVAHGFDPDARWDQFYDGVKRGWRYELQSLRHYLEHHRGQDRAVAWVRTPIPMGAERAWATLFADGRFTRVEDRYTLRTPAGTVLTGTVVISDAPTDFTGTVDGWLNNALLRTEVVTSTTLSIWLEAWDVPATRLAAIKTALDSLLASA
jgi:uncharacterized protein YndB with AHSA1/START domain